MSRLDILKSSLMKKEEKFNAKIDEYFNDIRQANGQPLNDKRCGQSTMCRWDRKNIALNNLQDDIEKTKKAIDKEESKIKGVEYITSLLPAEIVSLIEDGTLIQLNFNPMAQISSYLFRGWSR